MKMEDLECPLQCPDCHIFAGSRAYDNCEIFRELHSEEVEGE